MLVEEITACLKRMLMDLCFVIARQKEKKNSFTQKGALKVLLSIAAVANLTGRISR